MVHRFNERFILSLASNNSCIFLDDNLNILPLSSHVKSLEKVTGVSPVSDREEELVELKTSLQDTQPIGALVSLTRSVISSHWVLQSSLSLFERYKNISISKSLIFKGTYCVFSFHLSKILLEWI